MRAVAGLLAVGCSASCAALTGRLPLSAARVPRRTAPPEPRRRGVRRRTPCRRRADSADRGRVAHAAVSRARCTAPVVGIDIGTPRRSAGSGSARPRAQKPPSSACSKYASQLAKSTVRSSGVTCGVSMPISSAGPSQPHEGGGQPLVESAVALRYDVEARRQPGTGCSGEHQHPSPCGRREHHVQGVDERRLGERGGLLGSEGRSQPGFHPSRQRFLGDDKKSGHREFAPCGAEKEPVVDTPVGAGGSARTRRMSRTACQVPRQVPVTLEAPVRGR